MLWGLLFLGGLREETALGCIRILGSLRDDSPREQLQQSAYQWDAFGRQDSAHIVRCMSGSGIRDTCRRTQVSE